MVQFHGIIIFFLFAFLNLASRKILELTFTFDLITIFLLSKLFLPQDSQWFTEILNQDVANKSLNCIETSRLPKLSCLLKCSRISNCYLASWSASFESNNNDQCRLYRQAAVFNLAESNTANVYTKQK
jgi:hypothetical protein